MLYAFIATHRDEIIQRCRAKVGTRTIPPSTSEEIDHGVPMFLDQLVDVLRLGASQAELSQTAVQHGHDLLRRGFTVSQVVHDYGDICQAITELAVEMDAPIGTEDFRRLNKCLDEAIARAVTQYGREVEQKSLNAEHERLGFLAHEVRNLINTAVLAFEVLKTGNVGVGGSTGAVLQRSLVGVRELIDRSLSEVRLSRGMEAPERFLVDGFIAELTAAAALTAAAQGIALEVGHIDEGVAVQADRQVLRAVVMNLLQNAFKFTKPRTTVSLRVSSSAERVLIEVQDECGGIKRGDHSELFRPFEQRNTNRTGLGLGLAFSRWAVEASHGRLYTRDLPGEGCVFTVDLPRVAAPAAVADVSERQRGAA